MTLNEYQKAAMSTCLESSDNFSYMMLGAVGEMGELASKVAKAIRKEWMAIEGNEIKWKNVPFGEYESIMQGIEGEIGDILWFVAGLARVFGYQLQEVGEYNVKKLASRKARGKIEGEGDKR